MQSFFFFGKKWFAMTKEEWNKFIKWASPIVESFQVTVECHSHGQYDTEILTPIVLILQNIYKNK